MKQVVLLALSLLLLSACGPKLEGTYSDDGTIFGKDRTYMFKFGPGGTVSRSVGGEVTETKYEVDGNKVKIIGPEGRTQILVLLKDGSLELHGTGDSLGTREAIGIFRKQHSGGKVEKAKDEKNSDGFMTYQAKAKQSEAKVGLGAIFTAAIELKENRRTYAVTDISQLGFAPAGTRFYTFWYSVNGVPTRINVANSGRASSCDGPPTTVKVTASATSFIAAARGNIDDDATCDEWSINDARELKNTLNDVIN